jgi:hypothetical protein
MEGSAVEYGTKFSTARARMLMLGLAMNPTNWVEILKSVFEILGQYSRALSHLF